MNRNRRKSVASLAGPESGQGLLDAMELPEATLNLLFAALLLTALGAFLGGNLLLLDLSVFLRSGPIALACLALLLIFYTLARSLGSVTWGLVLTYGLILVMTHSRQPWLIGLVYVCAACGFLYALRFLRVARRQWGAVLLMGVAGAVTAVTASRISMTSFDLLPRLHAGDVGTDTLYNAGIAAMIKHYGVVSTGLHGLVETPYHVLSHRLLAGLSRLSGEGVFEVYGAAPSVLFVPILVFSVAACCAMLEWGGRTNVPIAWGLVCVLLVGFPTLLSPWLSGGYFISESYLVSLGPFLLGLPLLFKARLVIPDLLLVLLLAVLIADAKMSGGVIYAGLWLTRSLFIRGERPALEHIATLSVVIVAVLVTLKPVDASMGLLGISPLHFIRVYMPFGNQLTEAGSAILAGNSVSWRVLALALVTLVGFFVLHFLPSWGLIGWVAYRRGIRALLKDPAALYSLAAVGAGALVMLLLSLPGGSAYYFSNAAFFVALPVVVALLTRQFERRRVTTTAVLLLSTLLLVGAGWRVYYAANTPSLRGSSQPWSALIESLLRVRDTVPINVVMKADLAALVTNDVILGSAPLLYDPVNHYYCNLVPFMFPAVSERPWVDAIPGRDACPYPYNWYAQYGITGQARLLPGMEIHHWPSVP